MTYAYFLALILSVSSGNASEVPEQPTIDKPTTFFVEEAGRWVTLHKSCEDTFIQDASSHDGYDGVTEGAYVFGYCVKKN